MRDTVPDEVVYNFAEVQRQWVENISILYLFFYLTKKCILFPPYLLHHIQYRLRIFVCDHQ